MRFLLGETARFIRKRAATHRIHRQTGYSICRRLYHWRVVATMLSCIYTYVRVRFELATQRVQTSSVESFTYEMCIRRKNYIKFNSFAESSLRGIYAHRQSFFPVHWIRIG